MSWQHEHCTIAWTLRPDGLGSTYRRPWTATVHLAGSGTAVGLPDVPDGEARHGSLVAALDRLGAEGWEVLHVDGWGQPDPKTVTWAALLRRPAP